MALAVSSIVSTTIVGAVLLVIVALIIRNKIYTCLKDMMKELHKKKN